jgi:hypothetical protein
LATWGRSTLLQNQYFCCAHSILVHIFHQGEQRFSIASRIVGNIKKWKVKNEAIVLKKTNDGILRSIADTIDSLKTNARDP